MGGTMYPYILSWCLGYLRTPVKKAMSSRPWNTKYLHVYKQVQTCKHPQSWFTTRFYGGLCLSPGQTSASCLFLRVWSNEYAIWGATTQRFKIQGGVYANRIILHPQCDLLSLKIPSGTAFACANEYVRRACIKFVEGCYYDTKWYNLASNKNTELIYVTVI